MKTSYLLLAVLGTIIPCYFFELFIMEQGMDLLEFVRQLFANGPSSGFTADILISSAVFWLWSFREARQLGMQNWGLYVVLNLMIGLSCALPLFLWRRHIRLESAKSQRHTASALLST